MYIICILNINIHLSPLPSFVFIEQSPWKGTCHTLYSIEQPSVKIVSQPHTFGMPEEERTWNRATEQLFSPSRSPHVHSHFFVTKLFEFFCSLLRVKSNEQWRSTNENRKSNDDAGAVLSRELDVLQPTERRNLKHPTNTELLKPAKDTLLGKNKTKQISPWNPVMVKALFFPHTNIDRSCVQPGSENTMCPFVTI